MFPGATPTVRQEYDSITVYTFIGSPDGTQLLAGAGPSTPMPVIAEATSWTPSLDDANKIIVLDDATTITVTIPANASMPYPIGTVLTFVSMGTTDIDVAITSDTLVYDSTNLTATINAGGSASAIKVSATEWKLDGNLTAAP